MEHDYKRGGKGMITTLPRVNNLETLYNRITRILTYNTIVT